MINTVSNAGIDLNAVVATLGIPVQDMLNYAFECATVKASGIENQDDAMTKEYYLQKHKENFKIWQGKDKRWCTYLPDENSKNGRIFKKRKNLEDLENDIVAFYKTQEESQTVDQVFTEWNERQLERGKIKPSTHMINKQIYKRFFSSGFGKRRVDYIRENEWEDFLCECISEYKLNAKAFSNLKGIVKGFLKRAKKRGLIKMEVERFFLELDVSDRDFKKRVLDETKEVYFDDEMDKVINYIRENPDPINIGIALIFSTGVRVGELVSLKHEDFDGMTVTIKRTESRYRDDATGKYVYVVDDAPKTLAGYRTITIPSHSKWIIDYIRRTNPFGDYVFLNKKGERINTQTVRDRLERILKKLGITQKSPHKIRKTYGSILLDNGLDRKLIESQMGHTNITCTEQHYHRNRRTLDQRQKIIDAIPEFRAQAN